MWKDNPANLMLIEAIIARRPEVLLLTAAQNGTAASKWHVVTARPHVILMDINLPGISGSQALRVLLEDLQPHIFRWWPSAPTPCLAISKRASKPASLTT
jgi:CheY-like chemotaxis protein